MKANRICAGVLFVAGFVSLYGQGLRPPVPLTSAGESPNLISLPAGAEISVLPANGGFYWQTAGDDFFATTIYKTTLDGKKTTALDLQALATKGAIPKHDYFMTGYSADPKGGLVAIISWGEPFAHVSNFTILKVDEHGEFISLITLDLPFIPSRVVPFSSGAYLVAGFEEKSWKRLHLAILDSHGKVVAANLPIFSDKAAAQNHSDDSSALPVGSLLLTSVNSDTVYAYSYREPDVIESISASGKCASIPLAKVPAQPGETVLTMEMYALNGQLLLHRAVYSPTRPVGTPEDSWRLAAKHYWSVYDAATGKLVETFGPGAGAAQGMLAGYSSRSLYFLDRHKQPGGDSAYSLLHAKP